MKVVGRDDRFIVDFSQRYLLDSDNHIVRGFANLKHSEKRDNYGMGESRFYSDLFGKSLHNSSTNRPPLILLGSILCDFVCIYVIKFLDIII